MKKRTVDLGGPIHIADFGGEGASVVLVHGLGGSYANWMAAGPTLATRARVIAPDLLGFGRTPLAGREPTVAANVAMLARLIESEARAPAILMGNSMGGLVSVLLAAERPDLVAGLVLVCPALPRPLHAPIDWPVATFFTLYSIPLVGEYFVKRRMREVGPERVLRDTLRMCGADPDRIDPDAWREAVELARERATWSWSSEAYLGAARSLLAVNARPAKVHDALRKVRAPALITQGARDRLVPVAVSEAVTQIRPDFRLEVMEGVGHVPMLQAPERWLPIVTGWMDQALSAITRPAA